MGSRSELWRRRRAYRVGTFHVSGTTVYVLICDSRCLGGRTDLLNNTSRLWIKGPDSDIISYEKKYPEEYKAVRRAFVVLRGWSCVLSFIKAGLKEPKEISMLAASTSVNFDTDFEACECIIEDKAIWILRTIAVSGWRDECGNLGPFHDTTASESHGYSVMFFQWRVRRHIDHIVVRRLPVTITTPHLNHRRASYRGNPFATAMADRRKQRLRSLAMSVYQPTQRRQHGHPHRSPRVQYRRRH